MVIWFRQLFIYTWSSACIHILNGWNLNEQSQWTGIVTYLLWVESGMGMSNHSELWWSLTIWGQKEVWASAMNWDSHLLPEGGKRCEQEQWVGIVTYFLRVERGVSMSNELGFSLTSWGWKKVWAWAITVNCNHHLLAVGRKRCEHKQSQWTGIVTYKLRVEQGVSMSNHSELGLALTSCRWKEVWAWASTVNWNCHLQAPGGKRHEDEHTQ